MCARLGLRLTALAVVLVCTAGSGKAQDWMVSPGAGLTLPLSAEIDTPDPAYDLRMAVCIQGWCVTLGYTAGDGETEDGWIDGGVRGEYDYYMAGLTFDHYFLMPEDEGWSLVLGLGPWLEHTEYAADMEAVSPTEETVIAQETDSVLTCGQLAVGYRWRRVELGTSVRGFLGADNITSAANLTLSLVF